MSDDGSHDRILNRMWQLLGRAPEPVYDLPASSIVKPPELSEAPRPFIRWTTIPSSNEFGRIAAARHDYSKLHPFYREQLPAIYERVFSDFYDREPFWGYVPTDGTDLYHREYALYELPLKDEYEVHEMRGYRERRCTEEFEKIRSDHSLERLEEFERLLHAMLTEWEPSLPPPETEICLGVPIRILNPNLLWITGRPVSPFCQSISYQSVQRRKQVEEKNKEITVEDYVGETPLEHLFEVCLPWSEFEDRRFEGTWLVAPPRTGKTNALSWFIEHDLEAVARGRATVIILDGQGRNQSLVQPISRLTDFAPGRPLHGKLLYFDPREPIPINPFKQRGDKDTALSATLGMLLYFLSNVLDQKLSENHATVLEFILQLAFEVPNPSLAMLIDMLREGGLARYEAYLSRVDPVVRSFLQNDLTDPHNQLYKGRANELIGRFQSILRNPTMRRLFLGTSTLDFVSEVNAGRVILIDADKNYLQAYTEIYGRLFIALVHQVALYRSTLPESEKIPCYFYIDEAHDFIAKDKKVETILDQARKQKIALIVGNQRTTQISDSEVRDALFSSTATKFVARTNVDLPKLSTAMCCTQEFLLKQPEHHFAAYVSGMGDAVSVKFPLVQFGGEKQMSEQDFAALIAQQKARYRVSYDIETMSQPRTTAEPAAQTSSQTPPRRKRGKPVDT